MNFRKSLRSSITAMRLAVDFLAASAKRSALVIGLALMPLGVEAANNKPVELPVEQTHKKLRKAGERMDECKVELTETGKALAREYVARLAGLQAEIGKQLPAIPEADKQACRDALAAEKLASVRYDLARGSYRRGYTNMVTGLQSAREKLEENPRKMARAEMVLKNALAMADGHPDKELALEEARKEVENREKDQEKLSASLEKAGKSMETALAKEPELRKQVEAAAEVLEAAKARSSQALDKAGVASFVASDKLDAKLAPAVILTEATPYWLAVYAQQSPGHAERVNRLLEDSSLMVGMLVADGARWGKFGKAAEIHEAIQKAHPKSKEGLLGRLALAVALEHAVPIVENRPEQEQDKPVTYIDPVARYAAYEKACLAKELDPGFETLSAWSLRMVVDGDEPDEISGWGRRMLRSYRPDLVTWPDPAWRYVKSVETEINYTSKYQKLGYDRDELQQYQNILANGGICGRRAFFGRFILRAFGIPTTARSQPGHAALVRWTPEGWVCCLGGGWGAGNRGIFGLYPTDLDFLASTQARQDEQAFLKVKRAQWIGIALGEEPEFGYRDNIRMREMGRYASRGVDEMEVPAFWQSAAMIVQNEIIDRLGAGVLESVGEDIGESNESALRDKLADVEIPESERMIRVDAQGTITVPAAATSQPTNNTGIVRFMPSNLGGIQLHYTRFGGSDAFEYTFNVPKAGKYALTARLVTPAPKQQVFLTVNDATEAMDIPLPYTIGLWGELEPVEIELKQGENVLTFHRGHYFMRGVTIRDFTLTPVS